MKSLLQTRTPFPYSPNNKSADTQPNELQLKTILSTIKAITAADAVQLAAVKAPIDDPDIPLRYIVRDALLTKEYYSSIAANEELLIKKYNIYKLFDLDPTPLTDNMTAAFIAHISNGKAYKLYTSLKNFLQPLNELRQAELALITDDRFISHLNTLGTWAKHAIAQFIIKQLALDINSILKDKAEIKMHRVHYLPKLETLINQFTSKKLEAVCALFKFKKQVDLKTLFDKIKFVNSILQNVYQFNIVKKSEKSPYFLVHLSPLYKLFAIKDDIIIVNVSI
jgi:hypothetical protein